MTDNYDSLRTQIRNLEDNLRLIAEKESEFVEPTNIPLQLRKDRERLELKLTNLNRRLASLGNPEPDDDRRIPKSLFYLMNREIQIAKLEKVLGKLSIESPKPVVCIIHGDDVQCCDKFVDRLRDHSLRLSLGLDESVTPVKYYVPLPLEGVDELEFLYLKKIGEVILQDRTVSGEEINNRIFSTSGLVPVIIESCFNPKGHQKQVAEIIHKFLQFWGNWPQLYSRHVLLVCLTIRYDSPRGCLLPLRPGLKPEDVTKVIDTLEAEIGQEDQKFIPAILPRLDSVSEDDARDWVKLQASKVPWIDRFQDRLIETIKDIFEHGKKHGGQARVPMADLATELKRVLIDCIEGEGA